MESRLHPKGLAISILIFAALLFSNQLFSQGSSFDQAPVVLHHEIDGILASAHIPDGAYKNSDATLIVPSIGLNYKYWFNEKFALGWYNNIITLTYAINTDVSQSIERKYPVTSTIIGLYSPFKRFNLFAGPGIEFDKSHSYFVIRAGMDYEISISNDWYLSPRFIFDNVGKVQVYTFGFSIGRKF